MIPFALMISFAVIMRGELGQSPRQRPFAKENQFRQAFFFHRANPTFGKGIQIGTPGWKGDRFDATVGQNGPKGCAELSIPIMQNIAARTQVTPLLLGRAASDLLHPRLIGMSRYPGHAHSPTFQMREKEHIVRSPAHAK